MEERIVTAQQAESFNTSVKGWGMNIRGGLKSNARTMLAHAEKRKYNKYPELEKSISLHTKKEHGITSSITFRFAFQGLFVHLGVGRGYVREGNSVKLGRKYAGDEIGALKGKGYTGREIKKMRHIYKDQSGANRIPVDWFDVTIRSGMGWLAEYAGDFWGQRAMDVILDQMDKGLHTYAKYIKVKTKKKK
ncbi:hypothetical protein [Dysgonomonas termitidis]|uniref:Uncharacterized protein n=1 Tax=Dysgonomonas termitidis TaxID=1516126 RepID=A0ABV9KPV0_9BACT